MDFAHACWSTTQELAPWLFFGAVISAFIHVLLPKDFISRQLRGTGGIFRAVFLGVPLPLCSCGVIPAGIGLKKDGAEDGSALAFLISTPQTGVDSVVVSAAFLGWPFAIFKLLSAALTGIIGGLWVHSSKIKQQVPLPEAKSDSVESARTWSDGFEHGVQLIRSIWRWLLLGIVLSAIIQTLIPPEAFATVRQFGSLGAALAALVVSLPLYVCATASVPIAAALVEAGLPLGAALVFLMAGPATNVATIGAIRGAFGKPITIIYLTTVIVGSMVLGLGFDALYAETVAVAERLQAHEHGAWWKSVSAIILLLSFAFFANEEWGWFRSPPTVADETYEVEGLHCGSCVNKLTKALEAVPGVVSVRVTLNPQLATLRGDFEHDAVLEAMASVDLTARYRAPLPPLTLHLEGLSCNGCVTKLTKAVQALDGASGVNVTLNPSILTVQGVNSESVRAVVEETGYKVLINNS